MSKLTREQILTADSQTLRLWVAEHVMGWEWKDTPGGGRWLIKPSEVNHFGALLNAEGKVTILALGLPDYPGDIAAAWTVLERFSGRWPEVGLIELRGFPKWNATLYHTPEHRGVSAYADTPMLAICKAALLAVCEDE